MRTQLLVHPLHILRFTRECLTLLQGNRIKTHSNPLCHSDRAKRRGICRRTSFCRPMISGKRATFGDASVTGSYQRTNFMFASSCYSQVRLCHSDEQSDRRFPTLLTFATQRWLAHCQHSGIPLSVPPLGMTCGRHAGKSRKFILR